MNFRMMSIRILYFDNNTWKKNYGVILLAILWIFMLKEIAWLSPNFPRWRRQHHVIDNVQKYAQMIPLESIREDTSFNRFADILSTMKKPPYVVFFDKSNLNVTLNHLCNLDAMTGALERIVAVAFESEAEIQLNREFPMIPTVTVDFTKVKLSLPKTLENYKYITYQLILLLRARIVAVLAEKNINFWAVQQDTIWTDNFAMMNIEDKYPNAEMLFDTVGNDEFHIYKRMKGWICGSTFFVRGSQLTANFFKKVSHLMTRRQSPDSSIMTYLCAADHYKCVKLPKRVISSSNFFMGSRKEIPVMIQVDHESPLSKMALFEKEKFVFRQSDGVCNHTAVTVIKDSVRVALREIQEFDTPDDDSWIVRLYEYLHEHFGFDPFYTKRFLRVHEGII